MKYEMLHGSTGQRLQRDPNNFRNVIIQVQRTKFSVVGGKERYGHEARTLWKGGHTGRVVSTAGTRLYGTGAPPACYRDTQIPCQKLSQLIILLRRFFKILKLKYYIS